MSLHYRAFIKASIFVSSNVDASMLFVNPKMVRTTARLRAGSHLVSVRGYEQKTIRKAIRIRIAIHPPPHPTRPTSGKVKAAFHHVKELATGFGVIRSRIRKSM